MKFTHRRKQAALLLRARRAPTSSSGCGPGVGQRSFGFAGKGKRAAHVWQSLGKGAKRQGTSLAMALVVVTPSSYRGDETWPALGNEQKVAGTARAPRIVNNARRDHPSMSPRRERLKPRHRPLSAVAHVHTLYPLPPNPSWFRFCSLVPRPIPDR